MGMELNGEAYGVERLDMELNGGVWSMKSRIWR